MADLSCRAVYPQQQAATRGMALGNHVKAAPTWSCQAVLQRLRMQVRSTSTVLLCASLLHHSLATKELAGCWHYKLSYVKAFPHCSTFQTGEPAVLAMHLSPLFHAPVSLIAMHLSPLLPCTCLLIAPFFIVLSLHAPALVIADSTCTHMHSRIQQA